MCAPSGRTNKIQSVGNQTEPNVVGREKCIRLNFIDENELRRESLTVGCVVVGHGSDLRLRHGPASRWNSRVGHYSYAQAINEFGPPNREARLSNGAREVKWFLPNVGTIGTPNTMNNGFGVGPTRIPATSATAICN